MKNHSTTRYLFFPFFLILIFTGVLFYTSFNAPTTAYKASIYTPQEEYEALSLQRLLGQSIIMGIQGTTLTQEERNIITTYGIGGIILLEKNISSEQQLTTLISNIQTLAHEHNLPSLFIAIDQEGGHISRIQTDPTYEISQSDITTLDDAYTTAYTRGTYLYNLGVTMNFSPVIDPITTKDSFLWDRVFHTPLEKRITLGARMIEGYRDAHITPVLKHFPGHDNTSLDTHEHISYSFPLKTEYTQHFSSLFAQTYVPAIMMSHTIPQTETLPATLSHTALSYLKHELLYTGLTITDDLEMSALSSFSPKERSLKALQAGVDILLLSGYQYNSAVHEDIFSYLVSELSLREDLQTSLHTRYKKITSYKEKHLP